MAYLLVVIINASRLMTQPAKKVKGALKSPSNLAQYLRKQQQEGQPRNSMHPVLQAARHTSSLSLCPDALENSPVENATVLQVCVWLCHIELSPLWSQRGPTQQALTSSHWKASQLQFTFNFQNKLFDKPWIIYSLIRKGNWEEKTNLKPFHVSD